MDTAILKALGEYGVSLVLAGVTIYNYVTIVKANASNLVKVTQLLENNGRLLESLAKSQENTSASLGIIKSMLIDLSAREATTLEVVETTLDKVMCLKERQGLIGSSERDKVMRRIKHGSKQNSREE